MLTRHGEEGIGCRIEVPFRDGHGGSPVQQANILYLDNMAIHRLSDQQSTDLYEFIIGRHRASSFIITRNRARVRRPEQSIRPTFFGLPFLWR